jgi:glycosyltransferase involved in cell wall biosynthesis
MKIALVSFGHVDSALPLFKYLNDRNVDLFFCFAQNKKAESILDFSDKTISTGFTDYDKTEELLGKEIKNYLKDISAVQFFIFQNLKIKSFKNLLLAKTLANRLKQYDIIHFNGVHGTLPFLIYFLRRKKLIFTIHDIHSHTGERTKFNFSEKLNRFILKSKYPVIVQNLLDFKKVKKQYYRDNDKFKFIPFGELEIYREFIDDRQEITKSDLLFFGRISPYKGIEYLISAIEILRGKGIHYRTIIAGNGEIYFDDKKLNELDILLINKHISNAELVALIKNTKIVVCPYTDATQSGVALTAFAFNKPVIASLVGSFPEVVKDGITGALVKPRNAEELAGKIQLLLNDPGLLNKMDLNIQSFNNSGNYSWNRISNQVKELYTLTFS